MGARRVRLRALAGLEGVYSTGTYPRRAADATATFRAFAARNDGWEGLNPTKEGAGLFCPPVAIRKVRIHGSKGPDTYSYSLCVEPGDSGKRTRRWPDNIVDWAAFGKHIGSAEKVAQVDDHVYRTYLSPKRATLRKMEQIWDGPERSARTKVIFNIKPNIPEEVKVHLELQMTKFLVEENNVEGAGEGAGDKFFTLAFRNSKASGAPFLIIECRDSKIHNEISYMTDALHKPALGWNIRMETSKSAEESAEEKKQQTLLANGAGEGMDGYGGHAATYVEAVKRGSGPPSLAECRSVETEVLATMQRM